jgi:hypothetical protein
MFERMMAARACREIVGLEWTHVLNRMIIAHEELMAKYQEFAAKAPPATTHQLEGRMALADLRELGSLAAFIGPKGTFDLGLGDVSIDEDRWVGVFLSKDAKGYRFEFESKAGCTEAELRALLDIPFALKPGR